MADPNKWAVGMPVTIFDREGKPYQLTKIIKITPKGFIKLEGDDTHFRPDGRERTPDIWSWRTIAPTTKEHHEQIENIRVRTLYINNVRKYMNSLSKVDTDHLKRIHHLFHEAIHGTAQKDGV
jgi:hypothetical protein